MLKMINATTLRTSSNDAAMPQVSSDATDPAGFASLLRQTQVASAPPATLQRTEAIAHREAAAAPAPAKQSEAKAESSTSDEAASAESEATSSTDAASRARTQAQGKTKVRAASSDAGSTTQTKTAGSNDAEKTSTATDAKAADGATQSTTTGVVATDPALAQWLAALQRPAAAPAGTERAGTTKTDPSTDVLGGAESGGARTLKAADLKVQDDVNAKAAHGDDRFKAEFNPVAASSVMADQRVNEITNSKSSGTANVGELTAASGTAQTAPQTSVREPEAPTLVSLPTPVDAPDFAQALGVQLSVLTRDGVQSAELHLNPADMGPVSVQIVMDGTQARVDFGADMAATRQAIEAGLPELASALRDAGFTLAGGGVSQHSSGRSDANGSNAQDSGSDRRGGARRVSDDTVARVGTAARRLVKTGGLDLYA